MTRIELVQAISSDNIIFIVMETSGLHIYKNGLGAKVSVLKRFIISTLDHYRLIQGKNCRGESGQNRHAESE